MGFSCSLFWALHFDFVPDRLAQENRDAAGPPDL
jgi:hypothetical protein